MTLIIPHSGIQRNNMSVAAPPKDELEPILSADAIAFVAELHSVFDGRRRDLLAARQRRGAPREFPAETAHIRADPAWRVVEPAADYVDRRVEITGPTDRKLVINALNSGANGFMADFEDANSPTWRNQVEGQLNLRDAVAGAINYDSSDGRHYELCERPATLLVRPRGWHLDEAHARYGETPVSGALFDFGLYAFHSAPALVGRGRHVQLYLPKLEHYLEARLWNDVLTFTENALALPPGSFRATVLIETLPAAFQMDEILFELRDHSAGLNAGRWDYIFSVIKCYRDDARFILPDRGQVTMTVPFMRAYTELLVHTCHARGTFAMGGMAALIPNRKDPEATERAVRAVRRDKAREASDGFDGTWVAHPDVVGVARGEFDRVLGERPNQIARLRPDVTTTPAQLLDVVATPGHVTEEGVRRNLSVAFQYISFWLSGRGAAGIDNLMEDAATAEIARSQIWQWLHHRVRLPDGRAIDRHLLVALLNEELAQIRSAVSADTWNAGRPANSRDVLERVALGVELPDFLTAVAYPLLTDPHDAM
jgi:malate synthase